MLTLDGLSCFKFWPIFLPNKLLWQNPLDKNLDDEIKCSILSRHKEVLSLVKQKIDEMLNP